MLEKYSMKKVIEENKNKKWDESVIKEKYIASFGIEKWQEEEMLERIIPLLIEVSNYLGINPVPVVFDDIEIEDSST